MRHAVFPRVWRCQLRALKTSYPMSKTDPKLRFKTSDGDMTDSISYLSQEATHQLRQVFPISVEKMQFIRCFRLIVDVLNVEMFELL